MITFFKNLWYLFTNELGVDPTTPITSAGNGLSTNPNNNSEVLLGGTLTQDTTIDGNTNNKAIYVTGYLNTEGFTTTGVVRFENPQTDPLFGTGMALCLDGGGSDTQQLYYKPIVPVLTDAGSGSINAAGQGRLLLNGNPVIGGSTGGNVYYAYDENGGLVIDCADPNTKFHSGNNSGNRLTSNGQGEWCIIWSKDYNNWLVIARSNGWTLSNR